MKKNCSERRKKTLISGAIDSAKRASATTGVATETAGSTIGVATKGAEVIASAGCSAEEI